MAISVAVLVAEAADKLIPKLVERTRQLKIKNGMELDSEMGPIVTRQSFDRIHGYIDDGVKSGAKLLVDGRVGDDGKSFTVPGFENGFWIGGTLFDHVTPEMRIYKEEIFGPVLSCVRVKDLAAAVDLVNAHEFGNGVARLRWMDEESVRRHACVWDGGRALLHAAEVDHAALAGKHREGR
jgi:malonate-semialdehyde dehydrogenase (acetylating) / methylmalonate-semialdehyde dehydrogenase